MSTNFWLLFIINEAMAVLSAFIASSTSLTPEQKAAAEKFAADGAALVTLL